MLKLGPLLKQNSSSELFIELLSEYLQCYFVLIIFMGVFFFARSTQLIYADR